MEPFGKELMMSKKKTNSIIADLKRSTQVTLAKAEKLVSRMKQVDKQIGSASNRMESLEEKKEALQAKLQKTVTIGGKMVTIHKRKLRKALVNKKSGRPIGNKNKSKVTSKTLKRIPLLAALKKCCTAGKDMKVRDIATAVLKAGYHTKQDIKTAQGLTNFRSIVNAQLRACPQFKKKGHGTFRYSPRASAKVLSAKPRKPKKRQRTTTGQYV